MDIKNDREKEWKEVLDKLNQVKNHLNKVGNSDLTEYDYYMMNAIEREFDGIKRSYKA
jgi:hypothetical protein